MPHLRGKTHRFRASLSRHSRIPITLFTTRASWWPYGEIFVMKYDGTHVEQLTDNQWEDGGPAWQPHRAKPITATAHK